MGEKGLSEIESKLAQEIRHAEYQDRLNAAQAKRTIQGIQTPHKTATGTTGDISTHLSQADIEARNGLAGIGGISTPNVKESPIVTGLRRTQGKS